MDINITGLSREGEVIVIARSLLIAKGLKPTADIFYSPGRRSPVMSIIFGSCITLLYEDQEKWQTDCEELGIFSARAKRDQAIANQIILKQRAAG